MSIKTAQLMLEGKNFASTRYLSKKLNITKKHASILFYKLGWTRYGSAGNCSTYKRKGFELA